MCLKKCDIKKEQYIDKETFKDIFRDNWEEFKLKNLDIIHLIMMK